MMLKFGRAQLNKVRYFSTEGAHAPPKKLHGTVGRYAGSVYTAASKVGALATVETELKAFKETLLKSPKFNGFLVNPTIPREEKTTKINEILGDDKISYITKNLFLTMAANGKIADAPKVIDAYLDLIETGRGLVKAVVTTAEPLPKKTLDSIKTAATAMAGPGKQVDLEAKVDPSILGGLQLMIGDKFLDLSVSSRISVLSNSLEGIHL